MQYIRDVLWIKTLEKKLGRTLTPTELEHGTYGEPFEVRFKDGSCAIVRIPLLPFPEFQTNNYTHDFYVQSEE